MSLRDILAAVRKGLDQPAFEGEGGSKNYVRTIGAMLKDAQSALTSAQFRGVVVAAISEVFEAHSPTLEWNDSTLQECFGDVNDQGYQRFQWRCKVCVPMYVLV